MVLDLKSLGYGLREWRMDLRRHMSASRDKPSEGYLYIDRSND